MARAQVPALAPAPGAAKTALDRYVGAPDPSYKYELAATIPGEGYTAFVLDMTSQTWRAPGEVDRTAWKHWLTVITPDKVRHPKAFLYITGGSNNNPAPKAADENLARVAVLTGSVVAELRMVPNQPLTFLDDKQPRSEDEIVAYTWDKFLRGGDDQWPLRLPMTKAAVRAMDAVVSYCASQKVAVDGFVVAGASKRGWTAWTTAAVDRRVVAVVPLVIDLLNIVPSFKHHLAVYGYYAPAVADYEELGIMAWSDSPRYRALMAIEEPYEYRQRLTMPKFMVNATGDQFFVPDSWRFYLDQLPGVTSLRYVPNADHSLRGTDAWLSVLAWYHALAERHAVAAVHVADRQGRRDPGTQQGRPERGDALAGDQPRRARLPPQFHRGEMEGQPAEGGQQRRVRRPGAAAVPRLHGLHGRVDVPERRGDGALHVHDRRQGRPRHRAVQGGASRGEVTQGCDRLAAAARFLRQAGTDLVFVLAGHHRREHP